jgi:hypothetical protein
MNRSRWALSLAVPLALVLAIPAAAAPLPEDKSALSQVPATSPLVVYVHGVEGSAGRLIGFLKKALPEPGRLAEGAFQAFLENGVNDRKLRGLAKDGPIFVSFTEMPKEGEKPKFAVILAVTDYKAFRDAMLNDDERKTLKASPKGYESADYQEQKVYFVERKGYAVVTHDEKTAVAFTKSQAGIDTKISKEQAARLLSADVGVYLGMDVVNKEYGEQIKDAKEQIENFLKAAEPGLAKNQRGLLDAVHHLIGPVFQAIEDSKGVLLSVEFRPTAVVLHVESETRGNTKTAALLKPFKPTAMPQVDQTPSGLVFYTGLTANADLLKLLGPLALGTVSDPESQEAKAIKAAMADLSKAGPGTRIDVWGLPVQGVQAWQFAEPAKALAATEKILDSLLKGDTFLSGMLKDKAPLKRNAATFRNIKFHSMALTWDLEKMAGAAGMGGEVPEEIQKKLAEGFKKLIGEQTTVWIGADDKQLFTVTAPDWKAAEALLDGYFKRTNAVGEKMGFQEARKELPREATVVSLIDVVAYGSALAEIAKPIISGFFPLPDKFPAKLPKGDPSFIGSAVVLDERHFAADLVITASAVRDVYKAFIVPLRGGF